jgi:hypothetical protein
MAVILGAVDGTLRMSYLCRLMVSNNERMDRESAR